jgi:hypothetical protein
MILELGGSPGFGDPHRPEGGGEVVAVYPG